MYQLLLPTFVIQTSAMNIQEKNKIEYRSRINRVMDYIDMHLNEPLELKNIAEILISHLTTFTGYLHS
mgnify:CR=1 FL=1